MRKLFLCLLVAAVVLSTAAAQTVIQRTRLGNAVEAITYIPTGPYAKHIVFLDAMDFNVVPDMGHNKTPIKKLFSFEPLGFTIGPRGIAYIEPEKTFVLSSAIYGDTSTTFVLCDANGRSKGTVVFNWPEDFAGNVPYVEGIAWIPLNAPKYAGDIAFVGAATAGDGFDRIFIMTRTGEYVASIALDDVHYPDYYFDVTGLAYRDGKLLLGNIDGNLFEMDLDGNLLGPPLYFEDAQDIEGIAVLPGSKVVLTAHSTGKLIYLDANLNRTGEIRDYSIGFGVGMPYSLAWDFNSNEYLVFSNEYEPTVTLPKIEAISADMKSGRIWMDMGPYNRGYGRMDFVPFDAVVMPRNAAEGGYFYMEFLSPNFGEMLGPQIGTVIGERARAVAFVTATVEFAIARRATPTVVDVLSFTGWPIGPQFDLSPWMQPGAVIIDLTFFQTPTAPWPGEFLVLVSGSPRQLIRVTYSGEVTAVYDVTGLKSLGATAVKAINSGPLAGNFVLLDNSYNELIAFKLP